MNVCHYRNSSSYILKILFYLQQIHVFYIRSIGSEFVVDMQHLCFACEHKCPGRDVCACIYLVDMTCINTVCMKSTYNKVRCVSVYRFMYYYKMFQLLNVFMDTF